MNVLIIEDERPAAVRLEKLLKTYNDDIIILDRIDSVKKAVQWLKADANKPQLIFMDIQLADGLSFEIFEQVKVDVPVIFTTAYDEYALRAFKVNSIDYLLKPVDNEELDAAFNKLNSLSVNKHAPSNMLEQVTQAMEMLTNKYKSRFVIKIGERLKTIGIESICFFFSSEKATFCNIDENKNYLLDYSLEQLEGLVNPEIFFRINRKYLVSLGAISDIISYSNSRLRIILKNSTDKDIIVSRDRVNDFKNWLDR